jgi:hypothetical protein
LKFDNTKISQFIECLNSKREDILELTNEINQNENIDTISQSFIKILSDCSNDIFGQTRTTRTVSINKVLKKKPWFNADCYTARAEFKKARNAFVKNKDNDNLRNLYINYKNNYNKIKRTQKKKYNFNERQNLNEMSKSQPRKFWNKIRSQYTKNTRRAETLTTQDLYEHFKTMYSTETTTGNTSYNQNIIDEDLDKEISMSE